MDEKELRLAIEQLEQRETALQRRKEEHMLELQRKYEDQMAILKQQTLEATGDF